MAKIPTAREHDLIKERDRLEALYQYNILDTESEEAFDNLVELASYICGTPIALITLIDKDRQWVKAKKGTDISETPREISFCDYAIDGEEIMVVEDTTADDRFRENPMVVSGPNIRFYAGSPLITSEGYRLGTLCVLDNKPVKISETQKKCLETLADEVMVQMEVRRQQAQLQKLNYKLLAMLESQLAEKDKVLQLFTRFVPDEIVAKHFQANQDGISDAELKHLTVLFCDIRGYTAIVDSLPPKVAVSILSSYYTVMSEVVNTYSGMVNQYVGDEIFATFGAPFSFEPFEANAVFCALNMLEKLKPLNELCKQFTDKEIKIGIGIHSGEVITGTMGYRNKIEYSITGDTVNTGKRIESLTTQKPNSILISGDVYSKVKDLVEVSPWEPIDVKGKAEPIYIFEVTARTAEQIS